MKNIKPEPLERRLLFASAPTAPPNVQYHLTADPWTTLDIPDTAYLDAAENMVRALSADQNSSGQIIDRYTHVQESMATPSYAAAIGNLVAAGRATDLLPSGIAAMESATQELAGGLATLDGASGNQFLDPLATSLANYAPYVTPETLDLWRTRISVPLENVLDTNPNNHRAIAMKGEWSRALVGLVPHDEAVSFIEDSWIKTQRSRIINDALKLYHDQSSDPDSMDVETNARANLAWLLANGYDGPSRAEMQQLLTAGTANLLYLEDPTGQAPNGGRTSDNVWLDSNAGAAFELMSSVEAAAGDINSAGQLRRQADLAFQSISKWTNPDGTEAILKDQFDPAQRIGWSEYTYFSSLSAEQAYRFTTLYTQRLAEDAQFGPIAEEPVPSEIGGYALQTDTAFGTVFADAGGMQIQGSIRGSSSLNHGQYWSTLGITRITRPGWDPRLGPIDGERNPSTKLGVSFSPAFLTSGKWNRLASMPDKYTGAFSVSFTSPTLVRAAIDYKPKQSSYGPTFHEDLIITPDGVLSNLTSSAKAGSFGMDWPVLASDGKTTLLNTYTNQIATVQYPDGTDQQNYIALNTNPTITGSDAVVRGAVGDVRPVRMVTTSSTNQTFVYPSVAGDPTAQAVQSSFVQTPTGFASVLGSVSGNIYVGRTSAGGVGSSIDFDSDGVVDATFSQSCGFIMQRLTDGTVTNVETDSPVTLTMDGQSFDLAAYTPLAVNLPAAPVPQIIAPSPTPTPSPSPSPTPTPTVHKEFESLSSAAKSDSVSIRSDSLASGGKFIRLEANAKNDYVTYKLSGLAAGTYNVILSARYSDNYGIIQPGVATSSSGTFTNLGATQDLYAASSNYQDITLGSITINSSNSSRYFRFKVTGKDSASSGYKVGLDAISLVPI